MTAASVYVRRPEDMVEGGATIEGLSKDCADMLERHYPGWGWAIEPEAKNGIINIYSLICSGKWAYTLHIANVQNDPTLRDVLRAGGELLERFGFRRGPYSYAEFARRKAETGFFAPKVEDKGVYERRKAGQDAIRGKAALGQARFTTDPSIGAALRSAGRA